MKITKITVLGFFLCGALAFQLFMPTEFINLNQNVEAKRDELSNTIWNIKNTTFALRFDNNGGVSFLEYNTRSRNFDTVATGTYRVRGNRVTLNYGGKTGNATISGSKRNVMTGTAYAKGKAFTIRANRAGG